MRKARALAAIAAGLALISSAISRTGTQVQAAGLPQASATTRATPGQPAAVPSSFSPQQARALLDQYCVSCHNERLKTAGLTLDTLDVADVGPNAEVWEGVVRKLQAGLMPPPGRPRPDQAGYDGFNAWLETALDREAAARPNPGRTNPLHRLNRAEYQNAIRDVLTLDVDVTSLLPADDTGYGFDNIAGFLRVNSSLMEQYLSAAFTVSREAVGSPVAAPAIKMFRVKEFERQDQRRDDLPVGTRGGTRVRYNFPQDAEYVIKADLVNGGAFPDQHELEVTIDGVRIELFRIGGDQRGKQDLQVRIPVKAGPRDLAVTFLKLPSASDVPGPRARFERPFYSGAGLPGDLRVHQPALESVSISGPYNATGPGDTPSRRRIFVCRPTAAQEAACARQILASVARRAYRRPVTDADLQGLLGFYNTRRVKGEGFEAGIEIALRALLVSPEFLFRGEADPANVAPNTNYRISDLELASRLSFFLWSTIPDEQLLNVASRGTLRQPAVLAEQVERMLADPRSDALVRNFAGQWLQLRPLASVEPSENTYPNFDDTLREGFRRETELFVSSVLHENRSVVELLTANYTFVNERLARHYGIPRVQGGHFRRVTFSDDNPRRGLGLLGHGSVLTVSSRPNRTSPVLRGSWVLSNILGTPPPPPPANVPPLKEKEDVGGRTQIVPSMREQMATHRANPVCAACHSMIDPLGFALENFDGTGKWRDLDEAYNPIDTSGSLPNGSTFRDVAGFRAALVSRPERFASTVTERLLIYALGRGVAYYDMPNIRRIVREAAGDNFTLVSLIKGIVRSEPFVMRRTTG